MNILDVLWLLEETLKARWRGVSHIKRSKKLNWISTKDLDSEGKLKPNYLKDRERKKKKKTESKSFIQGPEL